MDFFRGEKVVKDVVDPEVRAYVSSLVSALGGSGADEYGRYVLGDDAHLVLRDLKKWLKLYDEKANRLDVARVLAESNLVHGDLLQILASWPEHEAHSPVKLRLALSCLELLVPLTWPLDREAQTMTVNHHRHIPYLQSAQLGYKRSIVHFDGARILHTAIRCALPSMAAPAKERTTRDNGIIKLVLYFLRNMAMLSVRPGVTYDGDDAEISRSVTIDTFDYQDVLQLLLTLSSSMGEDFAVHDVVVMEVIFHLIRGVDVKKLFMSEEESMEDGSTELMRLKRKEEAMLRSYQVNAPTRHNRFGTMTWMRRGEHKVTTISGQGPIADSMANLEKMDNSKKFKPPRRAAKGEEGTLDFDLPVPLTTPATKHLRTFVEDFLDSGFNPLFTHVRKAIDREEDRVLEYHSRQFFYLVSWFLQAERIRREMRKAEKGKSAVVQDSYALVASGLNQEMFITLNRAMDIFYENKAWQDLSASMRCFTQVLLTVQEMGDSSLEEDQEAAENILSRIFYEETTHDRVANITRTYKDQGFGYLDSTTELAHTYTRVLEHYSKQNVDLQVRSRRRVRRKKQKTEVRNAGDADAEQNDVDESDPEDVARAEQTSHERRFDFRRFAAKFLAQGCVDTFVRFAHYFRDLDPAQLKRCHRYFYTVAFKQEMSVMLMRVDILALLHRMIKGPGGLDPKLPNYKEWHELARQLMKRCMKKLDERPELLVEMLFSKTNGIAHFLEYGYEKQTVTSVPRAAAELIVKGSLPWEDQVGVAVTALLDRFEGELVQWIKGELISAGSIRRAWESQQDRAEPEVDEAVDPDVVLPTIERDRAPVIMLNPPNDAIRTAMLKNGPCRLLMTLVGMTRKGVDDEPGSEWVISPEHSADQLEHCLNTIKRFEISPPVLEDGQTAADLLRRKSEISSKRRAAFDDDDEDGLDSDDEGELLFEPGGPTAMKRSDALDALKKSSRSRRRKGQDISDEILQQRADARREKEKEKNAKIKSALFVHDSDDESDAERDRLFFEREERLRRGGTEEIAKELLAGDARKSKPFKVASRPRKRPTTTSSSSDNDSGSEHVERRLLRGSKKRGSRAAVGDDEDDDSSDVGRRWSPASRNAALHESSSDAAQETPMSSPHLRSSQTKRRRIVVDEDDDEDGDDDVVRVVKGAGGGKDVAMIDDGDDDDDDIENVEPKTAAGRVRARARHGFIVDSSDEE